MPNSNQETIAIASATRIAVYAGSDLGYQYSTDTKKNIKKMLCFSDYKALVYFETNELELWDIPGKKMETRISSGLTYSAFANVPSLNLAFGAIDSDIYMWSLPSSCVSCNGLGSCGCNTNQYFSSGKANTPYLFNVLIF